jgi:hypothetical protein
MQRGSDKHGARRDDELTAELSGMLGSAGGHREEWKDPEPPADDDPDLGTSAVDRAPEPDPELEAELDQTQLDLDVANDSHPGQDG